MIKKKSLHSAKVTLAFSIAYAMEHRQTQKSNKDTYHAFSAEVTVDIKSKFQC